MTLSRFAPWLIAALLTSCLALWVTADGSSSASAASPSSPSESKAFEQLAAVAAAHGHKIPDGLATYAHFGDTSIAHGPLDGIAGYTDADFQAGVLIMAIVVNEPTPGRVPNGAYVVQARFEPGARDGMATYFDAQGRAVASVPAHSRTPDEINAAFPGAYDPPPPSEIPNITSTHVWHNDHYAVDCAGWQPYHVVYY
jgi:hypothetical protein